MAVGQSEPKSGLAERPSSLPAKGDGRYLASTTEAEGVCGSSFMTKGPPG